MTFRQLEDEVAALEKYCEELEDAIDEFEHEERRCRDRLERGGGQSHQLTLELKRLTDNRDFNCRELERARAQLAELGSGVEER
ncbi:MAG: hypothetical protein WAL83_05785 [Arenicellales bacterium]